MTARDAEVANMMAHVLRSDRFATPGTYTQLIRWGRHGDPYQATVVMSDHLCEVADHEPLVSYARERGRLDHVLINGLGIGVAIELLAPYVERFTVVELSPSVIELTGPYYHARYPGRIDIICADALTYQPAPGAHYDAVFHDIWDDISADNLAQMHRLHRRYGRLCDWQQSWARSYCERVARKEKAAPEAYAHPVSIDEVMAAINSLLGSVTP